jgi:hypothetical protein
MNRRGWLIFLAVQTVARSVRGQRGTGHFLSALGPALWVIGSVLLLPGDLAGAFIVEKLLWKSGLTATQLTVLQVPVGLAIKATVWVACPKLYRLLRGRRSSLASVDATGSNLSHRSP